MASHLTPWTVSRIRDLVFRKFRKQPCLWQINVARELREKKNDVVAVAATGSGKTLLFWIGLLMALEDGKDKLVIVVTPLNILGKQNADVLLAAGIGAVSVDAENATDEVFNAIEEGAYRVIVFGPELVMMDGGRCEKLWQCASFTSKILYFVFDEGHCISEWSSFREQYKLLGSLRYLLAGTSPPFYIPSATLPSAVLSEVSETMHMRKALTTHILRSNDRPEIALAVRPMRYAASSYKDLDFIIPDGFHEGDTPPPKFLIFFDNTKEAEAAASHLSARLPRELQDKVKHFHATMTSWYRTDEFESMKNREMYSLCMTDSFGMGLAIPDIELIVQWKVPPTMNAVWQRFGRGARGDGCFAFAILIAEKDYFDEERERKALAAEKRKNQPSRKRKRKNGERNIPSKKTAPAAGSVRPKSPLRPPPSTGAHVSTTSNCTLATSNNAHDRRCGGASSRVDADAMDVDSIEVRDPQPDVEMGYESDEASDTGYVEVEDQACEDVEFEDANGGEADCVEELRGSLAADELEAGGGEGLPVENAARCLGGDLTGEERGEMQDVEETAVIRRR